MGNLGMQNACCELCTSILKFQDAKAQGIRNSVGSQALSSSMAGSLAILLATMKIHQASLLRSYGKAFTGMSLYIVIGRSTCTDVCVVSWDILMQLKCSQRMQFMLMQSMSS